MNLLVILVVYLLLCCIFATRIPVVSQNKLMIPQQNKLMNCD